VTKTFILSCAGVLVLCAAAAHAQPAPEAAPSQAVSYRDLDLSRPDGQRELMARVHAAAESVCGPAPTATDLARNTAYRSCLKTAESSASAQMLQLIADASRGDSVVIHTAMIDARE
jgi:UrcA family protein